MTSIHDFAKMKNERRKISMVTCYDFWTARILAQTAVDCVLVGDSCAMVMHGFPSTLQATVPMMETHVAAVARGIGDKFLVGDLPFMSFRKGVKPAMDGVERLMRAGAHAVKLEGVYGHENVISQIVGSGVPVMGHIGLTPQSTFQLGGFRVQGRDSSAADALVEQARKLEELGCFSIVLECVPGPLAEKITRALEIPTIGIGAGVNTDGQVLVLQDLLGGNSKFVPKFLRRFRDSELEIKSAVDSYNTEVKNSKFPGEKETYL
jgi:3-methyl-2-oxobutanoate hydroxymethyltransferase